ncbi:MAG: hypothetical protein ACJAVS_001855 [Paracoccaceae bacterium]|jgi:hypothetical protein
MALRRFDLAADADLASVQPLGGRRQAAKATPLHRRSEAGSGVGSAWTSPVTPPFRNRAPIGDGAPQPDPLARTGSCRNGATRSLRRPSGSSSCLIPRLDGAILSQAWKEALSAKFVTGAPRPRTTSEQQYSDRKLRSHS